MNQCIPRKNKTKRKNEKTKGKGKIQGEMRKKDHM